MAEWTPSEKEEAYFLKQEAEKRLAACEAAKKAMEEKERQRLKETHWMRCPKCGMELEEIEFRGVQVDHCFSCGGMFFDRGEIEKIIEQKDPRAVRTLIGTLFGVGKTID